MAKNDPKPNAETFEQICEFVAGGGTMTKAAALVGLTSGTLYSWLVKYPEFGKLYDAARELRAEHRSDEIDRITGLIERGDLEPNQGKVMIEALKWQAAKENTRRYGDKVQVDQTVDVRAMTDEQLEARIRSRAAALGMDLVPKAIEHHA